MVKLKYIPQYLLALLLLILIFLEGWTWYLGTPDVTFRRYMGADVPSYVQDLSLRRYKAEHSPHLFTMEVAPQNEQKMIAWLQRHCDLEKAPADALPPSLTKVDDEMVEVVKKSPYIYLTKYPAHRFCLLFRDKGKLYLYLNGDL